jgi:alpha-beta hydrolase superfamily lysophospholipase
MNEEIFEVKGQDGLIRRGIVTIPNACNGVGILLLPAGLKYRVGPARFYVHLARNLVKDGYTILRYDPAGLGESEGKLPLLPVQKIWRTLEEGRFVEDALLAVEAMKNKYGLKRIVSGGICGGAITSQLAAAERNGMIDGIVSINTSVTLAGAPEKSSITLGEAQAKKNYKSYVRKLVSRHAWKRLLTCESDIKSIFKTIMTIMTGVFKKNNELVPLENENTRFMKTFNLLQRKNVKHLLIFGGNDNRWTQFQDVILTRYLDNQIENNAYKIAVIPDANHELHFREWRDNAVITIKSWLSDLYFAG